MFLGWDALALGLRRGGRARPASATARPGARRSAVAGVLCLIVACQDGARARGVAADVLETEAQMTKHKGGIRGGGDPFEWDPGRQSSELRLEAFGFGEEELEEGGDTEDGKYLEVGLHHEHGPWNPLVEDFAKYSEGFVEEGMSAGGGVKDEEYLSDGAEVSTTLNAYYPTMSLGYKTAVADVIALPQPRSLLSESSFLVIAHTALGLRPRHLSLVC